VSVWVSGQVDVWLKIFSFFFFPFFFFAIMFSLKRFPRRSCQTGAYCALGRGLRDLQGGCKKESRVAVIILADISQFIRVSLGDRAVALPLFSLFSVDVVIDIRWWPM
jgi:hypothetical protein